jgi:hypothetical protein
MLANDGFRAGNFRGAPTAARDWRANFRVTRDNVRPRETTTPDRFRFSTVGTHSGLQAQEFFLE